MQYPFRHRKPFPQPAQEPIPTHHAPHLIAASNPRRDSNIVRPRPLVNHPPPHRSVDCVPCQHPKRPPFWDSLRLLVNFAGSHLLDALSGFGSVSEL
jgi:hypothetical protein